MAWKFHVMEQIMQWRGGKEDDEEEKILKWFTPYILILYYTNKYTILSKISLHHVFVYNILSSGSVISQVFKPTTNGMCNCHLYYVCCCTL